MRILRLGVAAAGLWALCSGPAAAIDPFYPGFGNRGLDVEHYDIALSVDPATSRIEARTRLDVVALKPLDRFSLDLAGLAIASVKVDGVGAAFLRDGDKLVITPAKPIAKGARFNAVVAYGGVPRPIDDPTESDPSIKLGWFRYKGAAYVVSEPVGASSFYPANDEPTDKATFRIAVTVPSDYTAAANGLLTSTVDQPGAKRRFVWEMRQPMTTWLATVQIDRYRVAIRATEDGKPLRFFATASVGAGDQRRYADSRAMIAYFEPLIGPYPFDSYGTIVVDDPKLTYALETQGLSTFPLGASGPGVVAHELAHQWFGNAVSVKRWADIWIAEGNATYFEELWKNRGSAQAFDKAMRGLYNFAVSQKLGPAVVEAPDQIFSNRVYVRGALTQYALRLRVGDETFYRILRAFIERYRYGNASSADYMAVAREVSGDDGVVDLLDAWLYEQAVPELPGAGPSVAARRPVATPDIVGLTCLHRGAAADCATAAR